MKKKVVALTALSVLLCVLLALCFVLKNRSPAETLPESGTQESRSAPDVSETEQAVPEPVTDRNPETEAQVPEQTAAPTQTGETRNSGGESSTSAATDAQGTEGPAQTPTSGSTNSGSNEGPIDVDN